MDKNIYKITESIKLLSPIDLQAIESEMWFSSEKGIIEDSSFVKEVREKQAKRKISELKKLYGISDE